MKLKYNLLSLGLGLSTLVLAQKSEISQAQKELDNNNYKAAIATTSQVESTYDLSKVDPQELLDLYYIKGNAYLKSANTLEASKAFAQVTKIENETIYWVKNKDTKEKSYFFDQDKAQEYATQVGSSVKTTVVEKKYGQQVMINLNAELDKSSQAANQAYNAKSYIPASNKFQETYYITKALGLDGGMYLYYAAISAYQGEDFTTAEELFNQIIDLQYEGTNPDDNALESAYKLNAFIYSNQEDWEKVIATTKEGLQKFPNNTDLSGLLASAYNKSGNDDAFIEQLKENIQNNPTDAINYYNLGVLYSRKEDQQQTAFDYFQQAIQHKSDYKDAYDNMARIIIQTDKSFSAEIDNLGTSQKDADREDEIEKERKSYYTQILPILEQAHAQFPNEKLYVQMLKIGYGTIDDNTNYRKYEALLQTL